MNVLGISGTPRINGNSAILVDYSLNPFKDEGWNVKHLKMSELRVQPCNACEKCIDSKKCVIEDDMHYFYEAFAWCDAIIVGSPVYYRNICSQLMAVLERTYAVREKRPLEGKIGGAIAVGRGTGGGNATVIAAIYNWMLSCGILCIPGELNGVTAVASEPGDVLKQLNRLQQAEILGGNVLKIACKLRS
jgi:multimeric flavodoxin WrbA